jgi:MYXO-CTERM domain-containing protein
MKNVLAIALVTSIGSVANASVVADWFAGIAEGQQANNVAANLSGFALAAGPGLTVNAGATFNHNSWDGPADAAGALAAGNYLNFGVSVDAGFSLALESMQLRYDRSGTGPNQLAILLSTNGFSSYTTVYTDSDVNASGENASFLLSDSGLTGNVEFRIVAWGATGSAGTFDIESLDFAGGDLRGIVLNGTVSAIPAPGAFALLGLGGLVATRRRR